MSTKRNLTTHSVSIQAVEKPRFRATRAMVPTMQYLARFGSLVLTILLGAHVLAAVEPDQATDLYSEPGFANPNTFGTSLQGRAAEFNQTKTQINALMDEFANDMAAFSGNKQGDIYSQVVDQNTKDYRNHVSATGNIEQTSNNWMASPLYQGDAGLVLDPGDGVGYAGPGEIVNFSTYRDPSTISNPTLRSLQTQLNKVNNIGSSAATKVNEFANRVKNSNNYFAKALKCSGFDWNASFSFLLDLETMKNYVVGMSETIAAAAPMALLGAYSPQLAELVKHFHTMTNFQLTAQKMDCSQMESTLKGPMQDMWGAEYSRCLQENAGLGVGKASDLCSQKKNMPQPDGKTVNADSTNSPAAALSAQDKKVLGPGKSGQPLAQGNDQTDADAANQADLNDAIDHGNNVAGAGAQNADAAALIKDSKDPTGPNKSMWDTVRSDWNAVTDNSLMNSLTSGWKMSATCTIDAGNNHWDLLKNLFDTESTKGKNALETALIDHFILLSGRLPVGEGNPAKTLSASREKLRQMTYGTRKSEWMTHFDISGPDGEAKTKEIKSNADWATAYRLNDTTLDGMSLIIYRVATQDGDVAELNRIYSPGKVIEGIMRYEVICWFSRRFEQIRERIKTSMANVKTATGRNKDAMDELTMRMEELEKKIIAERLEVEKSFVPYLPLYYKVRAAGNNRKKVNATPGNSPYGYTSGGQWFSDTPR